MAGLRFLALVGCLRRDGASIKIQVVTTARKKWTKEDNKFAGTHYLKAKEEGHRRYRKRMHQCWKEEGSFEIEEQHLACQVRSILKTKKLPEFKIAALRRKVINQQKPIDVLIENDSVERSDATPVIEIRVEQNHPVADGGMEGNDELHQNDNTQRIRRMMQGNSSDPIPLEGGIDALKVKSTVSEVSDIICNTRVENLDEVNDITCNIRVENLDELKNLLRAGARLVCDRVGVIANKNEFKEPYWKKAN